MSRHVRVSHLHDELLLLLWRKYRTFYRLCNTRSQYKLQRSYFSRNVTSECYCRMLLHDTLRMFSKVGSQLLHSVVVVKIKNLLNMFCYTATSTSPKEMWRLICWLMDVFQNKKWKLDITESLLYFAIGTIQWQYWLHQTGLQKHYRSIVRISSQFCRF